MDKSVIKPILVGVLTGALAYTAPFFVLKGLFFILIAGAVFRLFAWRRFGMHPGLSLAFADHLRNMSDEEYNALKNRYNYCGSKPSGSHSGEKTPVN